MIKVMGVIDIENDGRMVFWFFFLFILRITIGLYAIAFITMFDYNLLTFKV